MGGYFGRVVTTRVHAKWGRTLRTDVFLPSKHLLSAFYKTLPSKNPSKNPVLTEKPLQAPSKNLSRKHLLLENLLRTLLRSVRLHDPLGVHPNYVLSPAVVSGNIVFVEHGCLHRTSCPHNMVHGSTREASHGVGADGVGVKFLIFAVNCSRLPLSSWRMRGKRRKTKKGEGKHQKLEKRKKSEKSEEKPPKKKKIPQTPSTLTPIRTSQSTAMLN